MRDKETFERVYSENKEYVWNVISKYAFGQDREDLFQDVFLKVHRALRGFRKESNVRTWIYRIAVNESLSFIKRRMRQNKFVEAFKSVLLFKEEEEELKSPDDSLKRPLGKLNPKQRMVLIMAEVEERNLDEIGRLLGMPVGTVKSNLFRAKEIVKKELVKEGERP